MRLLNLEEGINEIKSVLDINPKERFIIGICGGSCSGKGYVSERLSKELEGKILSMDDYYKSKNYVQNDNYDTPEALDLELLKQHLIELKEGKTIQKPIYEFSISDRVGYESFKTSRIIILEGLFSLNELFVKNLDIKIFVDASEEIRLNRRLERDIIRQKSTKERILRRWNRDVQPGYIKYVEPQKQYADLIIINE